MTTHRDRLLADASAALSGRISDIIIRREGDVALLNAGRELMWTGYSPEAEFLKGLIVETRGNTAVRLVAGCLAKFYNWTENADNDRAFGVALALPGAQIVATLKADGSNLRSWVNPRTGQVEFATRGTLRSNPEETGGVDYSNLARAIAAARYPALLDANLVSRYTVVCELIHPTARILTNYGQTQDLLVITVIDLADAHELTRAEVTAFCAQHRLALIDALPFEGGNSLTDALTGLRHRFAGTDLEGAVVAVEHPSLPAPFRLKIKGETYLRMLALMRRCTLRGTVEKLYTYRINTWPELLGILKSETPDLPEEVVGAYRTHFERWAMWERENYVEAAQVLAAYQALPPNVLNADQKTFALAIANHPLRPFFFTIRKAVPGGELDQILPGLRKGREPLLRGGPDVEAAVSV